MTSPADKDALVKRLQHAIGLVTVATNQHDVRGIASVLHDAIAHLTAPAEAPPPAVMQLPPLNEIIYHAVSGLELDFGSGEDSFKGTINDDTLDWIWESINTALRCANVPSSAAPLPQSAPVSREDFDTWYNRHFRLRGVDTKHMTDCEDAWNAALAAHPAEPAKETGMKVTDEMINRFLSWRLPDDFCPDCFISFDRSSAEKYRHRSWPIGTNLLTADQARKMLEHVLGADHTAEPAGKGESC